MARLEIDLIGVSLTPTSPYSKRDSAIPVEQDQLEDAVPDILRANCAYKSVVEKFLHHVLAEETKLNQLHHNFTEQFAKVSNHACVGREYLPIYYSLAYQFHVKLCTNAGQFIPNEIQQADS